ncbi:recombinase RecT [Geomicrobium sediminis]|uniref:Recombination protein RecT n=1 Tax=Geomicrobium sediminis TaxID=1347788 RepID=A0ABS2PF27_9BACL|nr:recombinase RecT [Geomicrobium sediminis]MBM7634040.1 recombination protein RecT [Geomicrobium sediminis]
MATNQSLKNNLSKSNGQAPAKQGTTLKGLLESPAIKKRFEENLGKRSSQFITSIVNLYNSEKMLQKSEPMSVISSAMIAATMDLPVDKNLGYAYIVPYGNKATFQIGYKGLIQLALRTGQYKNINVIEIHEGELQKWNRLTEEIDIDFEAKESDKVVGYAGFFELINGFRKTVYWTKSEVEAHKKKFSKSDFGWKNDWDAMAKKTVIRNLLSKWGILSIELQTAYVEDTKDPQDRKEISEDGEYLDIDMAEVPEEPADEPQVEKKEAKQQGSAEEIALDFK